MNASNQSRINRRTLISAIPAVGLASVAGSTRATERTTVRFAYFADEAEKLAFNLLIDAFEEANPSIRVEPVFIQSINVPPLGMAAAGTPYPEWLYQSFTSNQAPDVFFISYRDVGRYVDRNVLEPLGSYLSGSIQFSEADFYQDAIDAFRTPRLPDGSLVALPQNASSLAVFYNTRLFDDAKVPRPEAGWTWDDFTEAAVRLTSDLDGDGRTDRFGVAFDPSVIMLSAAIWGAGGEVFDNVDEPTTLLIDQPAARDGIAWLSSLGPTGLGVAPTATDRLKMNDTFRFRTWGSAMLIQSRRVVVYLRQNDQLSWDVAPLPVGVTPANVLHSDGLAMWSGSQVKDAAWTFMEFALGPRGQRLLAESGRIVPSLQSVAESDAFIKGSSLASVLGATLPPVSNRVFLDNIPISRRLPGSATWPTAVWHLNKALNRAFYTDSNTDTFIQDAIAGSSLSIQQPRDLTVQTSAVHQPQTED